jgi:hypothetical protein
MNKQKQAEVKLSSTTTGIHSQVTDHTQSFFNEDHLDRVPNLKTQGGNKLIYNSQSKLPLKKSSNTFYNPSHFQSPEKNLTEPPQMDPYEREKERKNQREVDFIYDKIFTRKTRFLQENRTLHGEEKDFNVIYKGPRKLLLPKKPNYISDKIKDIKTKISFMKGVFDYAYPLIMIEKIRTQKKVYEEYIDNYNDKLYEKKQNLEKKLKTQINYNIPGFTASPMTTERDSKSKIKTDSNFMNSRLENSCPTVEDKKFNTSKSFMKK